MHTAINHLNSLFSCDHETLRLFGDEFGEKHIRTSSYVWKILYIFLDYYRKDSRQNFSYLVYVGDQFLNQFSSLSFKTFFAEMEFRGKKGTNHNPFRVVAVWAGTP